MKLVEFCNELLNNAELKITELKETYRAVEAQEVLDDFDDDPEADCDE